MAAHRRAPTATATVVAAPARTATSIGAVGRRDALGRRVAPVGGTGERGRVGGRLGRGVGAPAERVAASTTDRRGIDERLRDRPSAVVIERGAHCASDRSGRRATDGVGDGAVDGVVVGRTSTGATAATDWLVVEVHDPHAGGVAALRRDVPDRHADDDAAGGDHEDLVVEADHERGDHEALLGGELDAPHALAAAALAVELVELGALAVAGVGDDQDGDVVAGDVAATRPRRPGFIFMPRTPAAARPMGRTSSSAKRMVMPGCG